MNPKNQSELRTASEAGVRGAAQGWRAMRWLAGGAMALAAASGASGEGPWLKVKVHVSSKEVCVPSGPAYVKLSNGTEIYVPKGGMLYITKNDTEVETYIKKITPIPLPTGILPSLVTEGAFINSRGSTTQMSFNIPGLTNGHEYTAVTPLTGWVDFNTPGCGSGAIPIDFERAAASSSQGPHQTNPRPIPAPHGCSNIGLPQFNFHIDVPSMKFLNGQADTGESTFTYDPVGVNVGVFTFGLSADGRIVGSGSMEHDLLWDSPNYRMMDGSPDGGPVRFREPSYVSFSIEPVSVAGDVNDDLIVDARDLAMLLEEWGQVSNQRTLRADLNGDGIVDASDLSLLLGAWGSRAY